MVDAAETQTKPELVVETPLFKLDLGCGDNKKEGFHGVDIAKTASVDTVCDLMEFPWPFETESVDEVHSSHFFEHIPGLLRMKWMDELWRVMKPEAKGLIIVPYYAGMRAVQDPTHMWPPVAESSFLYFNKKWRVDNKLAHYPITCDFDFTYGYAGNPEFNGKNDQAKNFAIAHYINAVMDLWVTVIKRA